MITGEYDKLVEIAKFNVCSEHKTPLEVAWVNKSWVLRCGADGGHFPDAVTRQLSLSEELKAGVELPEPIRSNVIKGGRKRRMQQDKETKSFEYGLMPRADLGTGVLVAPDQVELLVKYAEKGKLDPWLGHVVLMYGKPYITIDGYIYHARQSGAHYSLMSRPMSGNEHDAYRLGATDYGWLAEVHIIDTQETYSGVGIVTLKEIEEPSKHDPNVPAHPVVANNPQLLCQKRAEWQALRRAFPIGGE